MIYPDENLGDWLKKTGLKVETYECPRCGENFSTSVPIVTGDYFGLESPVHKCGRGFTKVVIGARSDSKRKVWNEIFDNL